MLLFKRSIRRAWGKFHLNYAMKISPKAVKYVLMAEEMERAVAFYRDVIGFSESFTTPHWSELSFGDAVIGLHGGGDGERRETGLSIQYEDVQTAFDHAVKNGANPICHPGQREGEPIILAAISDPEGNVISLTQYVG